MADVFFLWVCEAGKIDYDIRLCQGSVREKPGRYQVEANQGVLAFFLVAVDVDALSSEKNRCIALEDHAVLSFSTNDEGE